MNPTTVAEPADRETHADHDNERSPLLPSSRRRRDGKRSRKTSITAIVILTVLTLVCLVCGFILPQMAQSYMERTLDYEIDSISLKEVAEKGANVRVTGSVFLNNTKASNKAAQRITDFLLTLAGPIALSENRLNVDLRHDGIHHIASTDLENLSLQLAYGKKNSFDMETLVHLHNVDIIGRFAQDVLVKNVALVPLIATLDCKITKLFSVRRGVARGLDLSLPEGLSDPPSFNITNLSVNDQPGAGIAADAVIDVDFVPPINAIIPSVYLDAAIVGCNGEMINLATGYNDPLTLDTKDGSLLLKAHGSCEGIPKVALQACDNKLQQSPVDAAMQSFLAGNETTVYLSGSKAQGDSWLQDLLQHIVLPVKVPGSQTQQFARDIVLSDVKFNLPSFFGSGGKPKISGKVKGTIDIPTEINVAVKVDSVHVLADLIYKGKKFAFVESPGWAPATSRTPTKDELVVEVVLKDAPVTITDEDVFSSVASALLGGNVLVDVSGTGDVKVLTSLGKVEAHRLPIEAKDIEIGGLGFIHALQPKIQKLAVLSTSNEHIEVAAEAEINNPTKYQVDAAYIDALMTYEDHTIGSITVQNLHLSTGINKVTARMRYAPMLFDHGQDNSMAGSRLLSQYLSEVPVNITIAAHAGSIPSCPNLSKALAHLPLQLSIPVPRIIPVKTGDGDEDDGGGDGQEDGAAAPKSQFLVSAKFHVFSSSASFVLKNPLNETVTVHTLHAVATYHDDVIGNLDYEYPITLSGTEPETETSRLPVTWKLPPSDILRKAVSGTLKVNATARATVSIGRMSPIPIELHLREVGAGVGI